MQYPLWGQAPPLLGVAPSKASGEPVPSAKLVPRMSDIDKEDVGMLGWCLL